MSDRDEYLGRIRTWCESLKSQSEDVQGVLGFISWMLSEIDRLDAEVKRLTPEIIPEKLWLLADRSQVSKFLADTPEECVLERMSWEGRLARIDERLAELAEREGDDVPG